MNETEELSRIKGGLLHACRLDAQGGAEELDWQGIDVNWDNDDFVWVHLDYSQPIVRDWLQQKSGLDPIICEALISPETRPRCAVHGDGILLNLRGVNMNPGAEPDDMISLRVWIDHHRLITFRQRRLLAVGDVQTDLDARRGPKNASALLLSLIRHLTRRASAVVGQLDENMDELEEEIIERETVYDLRGRIAQTRKAVIGIRRYLSPQRDALTQLSLVDIDWITDKDRLQIRELIDASTRTIEELDAIRDRAAVTHEELVYRLAERSNKIMYMLSVVAGIFLPLSLLTGLLGINVGGMPGMESSAAFWVVCLVLVVLAILEIWYLRSKKWL